MSDMSSHDMRYNNVVKQCQHSIANMVVYQTAYGRDLVSVDLPQMLPSISTPRRILFQGTTRNSVSFVEPPMIMIFEDWRIDD
jgi:hypothetical protein